MPTSPEFFAFVSGIAEKQDHWVANDCSATPEREESLLRKSPSSRPKAFPQTHLCPQLPANAGYSHLKSWPGDAIAPASKLIEAIIRSSNWLPEIADGSAPHRTMTGSRPSGPLAFLLSQLQTVNEKAARLQLASFFLE